MEILAFLLFVGFVVVSIWLQYKQVKYLSDIGRSIKNQQVTPQVVSSPNNISEGNPNEVELNENTPFVIPPYIKFEIEGGDTSIPPGYEERSGTP